MEKGYAALSFRSVAAAAGIGLGNLQHYFPTKADLIRAMLERAFEAFLKAMGERPAGKRDAAREVTDAIRYILADQKRRDSCVLFWELWALSAHDAAAAEVMDSFYARYLEMIAGLVRLSRPELTPARAAKASVLIASLIEGASLFRGHGRSAPAGFDKALEQTILRIVADS